MTASDKPEPAENTKFLPLPNAVPSTDAFPNVASDNISEPSASHLSVAKLYTIEWEPVTLEAAPEWVPTPVNDFVSIPNPPVDGSVL